MIRFTVKYYSNGAFSHSYEEGWEQTRYHCPNCGKKAVWHETGGGDYYVGEMHICADCGANFYLPNEPSATPNDAQDIQRLEAIRSERSRLDRNKANDEEA